MPHQAEARAYCDRFQHAALLMEMRLGKNLVVIRRERETIRSGGILVLAPNKVLNAWEEELETEGERFQILAQASPKKTVDILEHCFYEKGRVWVLSNYDRLRSIPGLAYAPWKTVVADESTLLKNPKAHVTQTSCRGFRQAEHRWILSGLPTPEGYDNLVCQFIYLNGEFMGHKSYWQWRNTFYHPSPFGHKWVPKPGTLDKIKTEVKEIAFIRRREDCDIGGRKVRKKIVVDMPPKIAKLYLAQENSWESSGGKETNWRMVVETWLARLAGGFDEDGKMLDEFKMKELFELLTGEFRDESVVVFFRLNDELRWAAQRATALGIPNEILLGGQKLARSKEIVRGFNAGKSRVLFAQIESMKYGNDLARASTTVYYSHSCKAESRAQSEDRTIHMLKRTANLYIDLVTRGTVEEDIVALLREKLMGARTFMQDSEITFAELRARYLARKAAT